MNNRCHKAPECSCLLTTTVGCGWYIYWRLSQYRFTCTQTEYFLTGGKDHSSGIELVLAGSFRLNLIIVWDDHLSHCRHSTLQGKTELVNHHKVGVLVRVSRSLIRIKILRQLSPVEKLPEAIKKVEVSKSFHFSQFLV